jgi:hypothetical protein
LDPGNFLLKDGGLARSLKTPPTQNKARLPVANMEAKV